MPIPEAEGERKAKETDEERVTADAVLRFVRLLGAVRLPVESWTRTESALQRLEEAVAAGTGVYSAELVGEVEKAASGHRIIEAGSSPVTPPPDPIRERLNRLIHALTEQAEGDGHSGDDQSRR
ncbi:CATRA system-associated protein [Microbispora bryophytorum]|uniref:CATRA system-associated protein n=1 Tax=Microbispora bryophytorum TaxID=1460882 RepID=UPI0033F5C77F